MGPQDECWGSGIVIEHYCYLLVSQYCASAIMKLAAVHGLFYAGNCSMTSVKTPTHFVLLLHIMEPS